MVTRSVHLRTLSATIPAPVVRRDLILDRLRSDGSVLVTDLASDLSTSEMTIRRDLKQLETDGLARRIHGGAMLISSRAYEPTFREKSRQFVEEKRRIGAAAAAMVEPGDTIILSPGTTTMELARRLPGVRNVTVITTAVNIAAELASDPEIDVIVTGGHMRGTTYALVGALSEEALRGLHVNKLFLGGNGLTVENGLTTPDLSVASTDRTLLRSAERVIVTVDHSKIGRTTMCQTAAVDQIDVLVTDRGISPDQQRAFESAGVEVLVV